MQLLVAIKVGDNHYSAQPFAANPNDRPTPPPPAINRPETTFVAQIITSWQGHAHTAAHKPRKFAEVSDSYIATSRLSFPERRTLDRSV